MPIEILMPALSPTMTEGNLAKWLKKEGDEVRSGDVLAEIETDKVTMEVEAVDDGTIGKILVPEGAQGIKVNAPIALLLGEGEEASALTSLAATAPEPPPAAPSRQQQERSPARDVTLEGAPPPASAPTGQRGDGRIFASPLARRMAQHAGLDLAAIVLEECFDWLDAPPKRIAGKDVPLPYAANLERLALPQVEDIVAAAREVAYR